jgi:alanyl-tRNA synthetase
VTSRIYYTEASCRTFEARVVRAIDHEGRPAAVLDRTAFYPTSGGQPYDVGTLGGVAVIDVADVEGEVVHVLSAPLTEGDVVRGEIDWARRFDHMQQHTGQHVLSAALVHVCRAPTVSFHLGSETSTIDLSAMPSPADVERAVDDANRIVWEDREVTVRFASGDEAKGMPLRKAPARPGELRLIEVPEFDLSACGGTHVARTGAIGLIAVTATEKFKGGLRLTFVCGGRALRSLRQLRDAVAGSVRALSVLPHDLPTAVEKLQSDAKGLRKTLAGLQASLAVHEADRLLAVSRDAGARRVITGIYEDWDAAGLKTIASSLIARDPVAVALVAGGAATTIVVGCAPALGLDAGAVVRQLTERFGGRGGGRPDMAQAGGLSGHTAEIAAAARALLETAP